MNYKSLDRLITERALEADTGSNSQRNSAIAIKYYGLDGMGGCSMQEVGTHHSLTRESVRQIANKVSAKLIDLFPDKSQLIEVNAQLSKSAPASASHIESELAEKGILSPGYMLEGIINMLGILKLKPKVQIIKHNGERYVLAPGPAQAKMPQMIESLAITEISHNGAVSVDMLASVVDSGTAEQKAQFVRSVMESIPETHWVGKSKDWLLFNGRGRNRLLRRLDQIFSIFESVEIHDLHQAISRNWKKNKGKNTCVLPPAVLLDVVKGIEGYQIENDVITLPVPPHPPVTPKEFELKIFNLLLSGDDYSRREKHLEDCIVASESDKWSFSVALNYCPLFVRKKRGLYRLAGVPRKLLPVPP